MMMMIDKKRVLGVLLILWTISSPVRGQNKVPRLVPETTTTTTTTTTASECNSCSKCNFKKY